MGGTFRPWEAPDTLARPQFPATSIRRYQMRPAMP